MLMLKLYAKNDIEGLASAILFHYAYDGDIEVIFKPYNQEDIIDLTNERNCFVLCLNADKYKGVYTNINSYKKVVDYIETTKPEKCTNRTYKIFCNHMDAYIDWTWQSLGLFYAKNIDELSKYYNKNRLIETISNRIKNNLELVTDEERNNIIFSKRIISDYVDKKDYKIKYIDNFKIVYSLSDINEIELANKLLEKEEADIAVVTNLSTGLVRIKCKNNCNYIKKLIKDNGGKVHSTGGTFKMDTDEIYKTIFDKGIFKIFE